MEEYKTIEYNLSTNEDFSISQTFGHPFKDFEINNVAYVVDYLISSGLDTILPSLNLLYDTYISRNNDLNSNLTKEEVFGRIARMWASFVREWHSYYLLKYLIEKNNYDIEIYRFSTLDTILGIDVYLRRSDLSKALKIDILQGSRNSLKFRYIKDNFRKKEYGIPGKTLRVILAIDTPDNTKYLEDVNGYNWYLLKESKAEDILREFNEEIRN